MSKSYVHIYLVIRTIRGLKCPGAKESRREDGLQSSMACVNRLHLEDVTIGYVAVTQIMPAVASCQM